MFVLGAEAGLPHSEDVRRDIDALNFGWLCLIRDQGRIDRAGALNRFRISSDLLMSCGRASRQDLMASSRIGAPLFYLATTAVFLADMDRVLNEPAGYMEPRQLESLNPIHQRAADNYRNLARNYLLHIREVLRRDPATAVLLFGVDTRLMVLRDASLTQIDRLAALDTLYLVPVHPDALRSNLMLFCSDQLATSQRENLKCLGLLVDTVATPLATYPISKETVHSDRLATLKNVAALTRLGCRLKLIQSLTTAYIPDIQAVMESNDCVRVDKGGRKPTRLGALIESVRTHIASSFLLRNYVRARQLFNISHQKTSQDAFIRALSLLKTACIQDAMDPDVAYMMVEAYHVGEVRLERCTTCACNHLVLSSPAQVGRHSLTGDCPICRELESVESNRTVLRLAGRRRRFGELTAMRQLTAG